MWWAYVAIVVVHGLIHLMGVVEGFGLADVEQLTEPVGGAEAVLWLVAAVAVLGAAAMTAVRARGWWLVTAVAAVVSQVAILTSWTDALAGTPANMLMLVVAAYGFAARGQREGTSPGARG